MELPGTGQMLEALRDVIHEVVIIEAGGVDVGELKSVTEEPGPADLVPVLNVSVPALGAEGVFGALEAL